MRKIYLAGPINGCTDEQAKGWRREATGRLKELGFEVLDPMSRDFRGREHEDPTGIVEGDKADIRASTAVLVNATRATWGTAMEVGFAHGIGKPVVAWAGEGPWSPWLAYHCVGLRRDLKGAVNGVVRLWL